MAQPAMLHIPGNSMGAAHHLSDQELLQGCLNQDPSSGAFYLRSPQQSNLNVSSLEQAGVLEAELVDGAPATLSGGCSNLYVDQLFFDLTPLDTLPFKEITLRIGAHTLSYRPD